jgi:3-deoxy-manno-octulosonate cytidylyltransferase (CMP-KDO synthetase)
MNNIAIIIPSRLNAKRLPNKPLKLINNKEMILHVQDVALKANVGEVYVATPDQEIFDLIKRHGGNSVLTSNKHETGTDRIHEVFEKELNSKPDLIINFQGDMPNLSPIAIKNLTKHMGKNLCDIGTLASDLEIKHEEKNLNVVKVLVNNNIENNSFSRAIDFFRSSNSSLSKLTYHHIGIYAFTKEALLRYVSLKRSKKELDRKLEQLRALENNMKIDVGYISEPPLSVDTEEDFKNIKKIMEKNVKN